MPRSRPPFFTRTAILGLAASAALLAAADAPRPHKSVYGTLESIDPSQNGVVMRSDAGQKLAWKFEARVVKELGRFNPGAAMIVIYRQTAPNEKRVTAVAFPGTAATPVYRNLTGYSVVVRSAPMVGGVCGKTEAATVREKPVPDGGLADVADACWCCAVPGDTCTPGNKSGNGEALLVGCFK
jgi:hypothetical protein